MFTGIVEEIGIIKGFTKHSNGAEIVVGCEKVLKDTVVGDSICVNGCCQTVAVIDKNGFTANLSDETLSITNFSSLKPGSCVNLERALTLESRLGGHIVQGHVDGTARLLRSEKNQEFCNLYFKTEPSESKYIVRKGSVAVNGVSLTAARVEGDIFTTAVIPYTMENTTLGLLKDGDIVNIETDILGRYVEKFLSVNDNNGKTIDEKFLLENGFLDG